MHLIGVNTGSASVSFTEAELLLINNSLNEILNGIDISEFQTRLGVTQEDARELLNQVGSLLDTMKREGQHG